jgi:hypothetical protein
MEHEVPNYAPHQCSIVKVRVKLTLQQAIRPRGGGEAQLYSFFNLGARWGGWSTPRPGRFTPGEATRSIVEEAAWTLGPVWTGAENLAPNRNSNPEPSSP